MSFLAIPRRAPRGLRDWLWDPRVSALPSYPLPVDMEMDLRLTDKIYLFTDTAPLTPLTSDTQTCQFAVDQNQVTVTETLGVSLVGSSAGWTLPSGWTSPSANAATCSGAAILTAVTIPVSGDANKTYKLSFDYVVRAGTFNTYNGGAWLGDHTTGGSGTITRYVSGASEIQINNRDTLDADFSNIQYEEVTRTFAGLGAEEATTMTAVGGRSTLVDNHITCTASAITNVTIGNPGVTPEVGKFYLVEQTISGFGGGQAEFSFGGFSSGVLVANGTYAFVIRAETTGAFTYFARYSGPHTFTLEEPIIKEIPGIHYLNTAASEQPAWGETKGCLTFSATDTVFKLPNFPQSAGLSLVMDFDLGTDTQFVVLGSLTNGSTFAYAAHDANATTSITSNSGAPTYQINSVSTAPADRDAAYDALSASRMVFSASALDTTSSFYDAGAGLFSLLGTAATWGADVDLYRILLRDETADTGTETADALLEIEQAAGDAAGLDVSGWTT